MSWEDILQSNLNASSPETQARIDLYKNQAIGVGQENRIKGLQLQYQQGLAASLPGALSSNSGGSQPASGGVFGNAPGQGAAQAESSGVAGADGDEPGSGHVIDRPRMINWAQGQFAPVLPGQYSPGEIQSLQYAALSGNTAATDFIQKQHLLRVDTANAKNTQRATSEYAGLVGVASAPDGRALDALSLVEPQAATRFRNNGATDAEVKNWATEAGAIVHRAGRLPIEYRADGTAIDGTTKQPVLGFDDHVGLTAEQRAGLAKSATEKVDVITNGGTEKQPRWQAEGANSAKDWLAQHIDLADNLRNGTSPSQQPTAFAGPNTPAARIFSPPGDTTPAPQGSTQPQQGTPQQQAPGQAPQRPTSPQYDFSDAPPKPPYLNTGSRMPNEAEKAQTTEYVKAQTDLLKDANSTVSENQRALLESKRMLTLLPDAKVGPGSAILAKLQNGWAMMTGQQAADMIESNSTAYSILAKKLGQSALEEQLSKLKSEGAQVRLGAQESGLILNTLSASPEMGKGAIDQLLRWQIGESNYELHKAQAVGPYLKANKDATQFETWYQQRYPFSSNAPAGLQKPTSSQSTSGSQTSAPVQVKTRAQAMALPAGTVFLTPDGRRLVR